MKKLLQAYDQLVAKHESRLEFIESQEYLVSFAAHDFFSLEPFYHEMNNIPVSQAVFYASQEELPEDGYVYICAIIDHKLAYVRNAFGGETYYDSFFYYHDNESWRMEIYASEQGKKPVRVERLVKDENGAYVSFESYSEHGYQKFDYKYTNAGLEITASYFDAKNRHHMDRNFQVIINYTNNSVESILETENDSHTLIYDKTLTKSSLPELLRHAQSTIVETILTDLGKTEEIEGRIDYMLLEYTMQHPFPPTLAMDALPSADEIDYPLEMYSSPDMMYFSEDCLDVNFYNDNSALYDTINAQLTALADEAYSNKDEDNNDNVYEQIDKLVFESYSEICHELNDRMPPLKKKFEISDDFHVIARDFEQCNEIAYIKELFTKEKYAEIEKAMDAYEKKSMLNEEDQASFDHLEQTLEQEEEKHEALKKTLKMRQTISLYTTEPLYYLEPFGYEFHHYKAGGTLDFDNSETFSTSPKGNNYYEHILENGELIGITEYQDGALRSETFYLRTAAFINEWSYQYYDTGLGLRSFKTLHLKDNRPDRYETYQYKHIETTEYEYDAGGKIIRDKNTRCLIDTKYIHKDHSEHIYTYNKNHELQQITCVFDNGKKSNTVFCADDSFMQECITDVVERCHNDIMAGITKQNIKDTLAIVLEISIEPVFPLYYFYLLLPEMKNNIHWERINVQHHDPLGDDNLYLNFAVYTASGHSADTNKYFTPEEAAEYVKSTLVKIGEKLQHSINTGFDKNIGVYIKPITESTERIDKIMLEYSTVSG